MQFFLHNDIGRATKEEKAKLAAEYEALVGKKPRKDIPAWNLKLMIESWKRIKEEAGR